MLNLLDHILEFLFSLGLYYFLIISGILSVPLAAISLVRGKVELAALLLINCLSCYWFVKWTNNPSSYLDVTVAALFYLIVVKVPWLLKLQLKIPYWISLLIYLGILCFGI